MAKGTGICPVYATGSSQPMGCKGNTCALWESNAEMCSLKAQGVAMADISDRICSLNETLKLMLEVMEYGTRGDVHGT